MAEKNACKMDAWPCRVACITFASAVARIRSEGGPCSLHGMHAAAAACCCCSSFTLVSMHGHLHKTVEGQRVNKKGYLASLRPSVHMATLYRYTRQHPKTSQVCICLWAQQVPQATLMKVSYFYRRKEFRIHDA
jgi:hypothetical protein